MQLKQFFCCLFLCLSMGLFAQTGLEIQIEAAKAELNRTEEYYSKQHINYADQALILADLYYQSNELIGEGYDDAEGLAKEALRFYRDVVGKDSPSYYEALKILPTERARFHHLQMNVEDGVKEGDRTQAFHLIKLAEYYIEDEDYEAHDLLLKAYRLLKGTATDELNTLFENIPRPITKIIKLQVELETLRGQPFEDGFRMVMDVQLKNDEIAAKFFEFMLLLSRIYQNKEKEINTHFDLLSYSSTSSYVGFRKLLNYYKEKNNSSSYTKGYRVFPKLYKPFYKIEQAFQTALKQHKTTSDLFFQIYKQFLKELDADAGTYVNYSIQETFEWVLEDIRTTQSRGKNHPAYAKVLNIQKYLRLSENERFIQEEGSTLDKIKENLEHYTEDYIQRRIKLGIVEAEEVNELTALDNFQEAIYVARMMDQGKSPLDELSLDLDEELDLDLDDEELDLDLDDDDLDLDLDEDLDKEDLLVEKDSSISKRPQKMIGALEQKYMARIPTPWGEILKREDAIKDAWTEEEYIFAYLEAGYSYLKNEILETRGYGYIRNALKKLEQQPSYNTEALKIIERIVLIDWNQGVGLYDFFELKKDLIRVFSAEELDPLIRGLLKKIEARYDNREKKYAEVLAVAADINYIAPNPQRNIFALNLYQEALDIYLRNEGKFYGYYDLLNTMTKKAIEGNNAWPVETMAVFFEERLQIAKETDLEYGNLSWHYFEAIRDFIKWHYEANRFVSAEAKLKSFLKVLETQGRNTKKQYGYPQALMQLARVYRKTGRFSQSFEYYNQAIAATKDFEEFSLLIEALDGTGLLLQAVGEYDQALIAFKECLDYIEQYEALGKLNRKKNFDDALMYIKVLRHIGRLHLDMKNYDQAMDYFQSVIKFESTSDLVDFKYDLSLQRDLALWYDAAFEDEQAEHFYKNAVKKLKDKNDIADAEIKLADFYMRRGKDSLAESHLLNALAIDLDQLKTNYSNLAEAERLLFLNTLLPRIKVFYSYVAKQQDTVLIQKMLNTHLIIKGLALENTTNIRSVVYASENVKLKNMYAEMQALRQKVATSAGLSLAERKEKGIDISFLNQKIKEKEEAISRESKTLREIFKRENKQVNFKELQNLLGSNAVAIDFMVIQEREDDVLRDYYYALLVRPEDSFPKLIRLCLAEDLNFALEAEIRPNGINYITDAAESYYIYTLVWEPLAQYLENYSKVHICPTGVMAKIAFATLQIDNFSGKRLMDHYELYYHTALRDLLERPIQEGASVSSRPDIMLIGGVRFDMNARELKEVLRYEATTVDTTALDNYGKSTFVGANRLSEAFNYLPGTLREINKIESIFEGHRWLIRTSSGFYPLESSIAKQLRQRAPTILHIATHGFFFPERKEKLNLSAKKENKEKTIEDLLAEEPNPLLRSGLALAGINHVWRGGERIPNLLDGIFTAYEVANLDLFNTELVVLSACETGQGDINNNEGVIGLQRAFKMAGARRLIISLWKVPDNQTSELMGLFYQNFLKENMEIHEAFESAQHEMRRRYPNAYYWAAFILVE